jgi:hypothetical protein
LKNLNIIFTVLLITFTSYYSIGQEYELEEKTVTAVFEMPEKNKSELFSSINKWISINYNSSKNVIQMNDLESGTIIVKGINEVVYKNNMKTIYPNNKYISEYTTAKFNHLIEINIKENRYRIIYKIIDVTSADPGADFIIVKCINLNGSNESAIRDYNELLDESLKKALIGAKKREEFQSQSKPMFNEINTQLLNDIKQTMKSIEKSVKSKSKEEW